jgi:hypothetical protein
MKTKSTLLLALPIAAALGLLAPAASAQSLMLGYHNFDGTLNAETPDFIIGGMTATLTKSSLGSGATGGSSDGFYGDSSIVVPTNNGFVRVGEQTGAVSISVSNNTGYDYIINTLLFDARVIVLNAAGQEFQASYQIDGSPVTPTNFVQNTIVAGPGADSTPESQDYTDFRSPPINNSSLLFPSQSVLTIFFQTIGANTVGLDNIAILATQGDRDLTIIPEPGSMLALGCILTSGLALRSRRRAVKAS